MFIEWMRTLKHFLRSANSVMVKDINGKPFSRCNQILFYLIFWFFACIIVWHLPKGLGCDFIDYIKDIFAIFVGFFVTVLCFVFDKLDTGQILSHEEENRKSAQERGTSRKNLKIIQEHNYTVRFFYTIGLIILYSATVIFMLIPNIFWDKWLNINVDEFCIIDNLTCVTWEAIGLFLHLAICVIYRFVVILLTIKVFYFTAYSVSSLLQVLITKKKLKTWS